MLVTDFECIKQALKCHYFTAMPLEICAEENSCKVNLSFVFGIKESSRTVTNTFILQVSSVIYHILFLKTLQMF